MKSHAIREHKPRTPASESVDSATKGGQKMKNETFKKLKAISAAICMTSSIVSYLAAIVLLAIVAPWALFLTNPVTFLFATLIFSIFAD